MLIFLLILLTNAMYMPEIDPIFTLIDSQQAYTQTLSQPEKLVLLAII